MKVIDGGDPISLLREPMRVTRVAGWSPDGSTLLFETLSRSSGLWRLNKVADGSFGKPSAFLQNPFNQRNGQFSPDGRFLLYSSDETGRLEIYLRRFPEGTGQQQVSLHGGILPRWSRTGKEVFLIHEDRLLAVPITDVGGSLSIGFATTLFQSAGLARSDFFWPYDVAPDGKRFLIAEPVEDEKAKSPAIQVIENWPALLRQKLTP